MSSRTPPKSRKLGRVHISIHLGGTGAHVKVVITDHRFPDVEQERRAVEASGGTLVVAQLVHEQELAELCREADGVLTVRAPITKRVIAAMKRCRIIVRYGIGVDSI